MGAAGPWGPEDGSIALLPRKMSQSSGFLCVPSPCCLHFLKMGRSVKRRALTLLMLLRRRKRHLEKVFVSALWSTRRCLQVLTCSRDAPAEHLGTAWIYSDKPSCYFSSIPRVAKPRGEYFLQLLKARENSRITRGFPGSPVKFPPLKSKDQNGGGRRGSWLQITGGVISSVWGRAIPPAEASH